MISNESAACDRAAAPFEDAAELAKLRAEIIKLRKINSVLMDRVENDMSAQSPNGFTLFQAAITLDNRVAERTTELTRLTHQLFEQINERYTAEKALLIAKGDAEKANLSKTRFLAAASPDLHQPLNIARLFLGLVGQQHETGRTQEYLAD
ncbi:Histidine kinase (fragment) [Methylocella tundrae]|uniref:Histidine kinase n=1 Tax=Methylocella tundrae TaxID=227605 RepID=A0A8B6MAD7_METTU